MMISDTPSENRHISEDERQACEAFREHWRGDQAQYRDPVRWTVAACDAFHSGAEWARQQRKADPS